MLEYVAMEVLLNTFVVLFIVIDPVGLAPMFIALTPDASPAYQRKMALNGTLFNFLQTNDYQGHALLQDLGGWLKQAEAFRGRSMICYHKNWAYLEDRFQVKCADYIEPKPGIPPTPGHVADIIKEIQEGHIKVLLAASYFDRSKVQTVADRSGATLVQVPMQPGVRPGVNDYFTLVDTWVTELAAAFTKS